jgi:hypothetical protein
MPAWREALAGSAVLDLLAGFDPRIAGTLPLGVSIAGSDIDILCHAPEPNDVADCLWQARERLPGLVLRRWISGGRPLVATFAVDDWPVEVFASPVEVERQAGWRHFVVERRLLELAGEALRQRVLGLRRAGARTEPAFAAALCLQGDPYAALYRLSRVPDSELRGLLIAAGFP